MHRLFRGGSESVARLSSKQGDSVASLRGAYFAGSALVGFSFLVGLSLLAGAPAEAAYPGQNGRIACTGERSTVLPAPGPSPSDPATASRREIYTMDPDTGDAGGVRLLTNNRVDDNDPDYSPDGRRLVLESYRSASSEAYTMDADGTNLVRLTFRSQEEFQGDWSPDGKRLIFQVGAGTDFDILRMNANGSDQVLITGDPANDGRPAWTLDGSRIAFDSARIENQSEIFTMDAEVGDFAPLASPLTRLTTNPARDRHPQYSPDGRKIVFQSNRDRLTAPANDEIFTMNADGTGVTRLTFNAVDDPATPANEASDTDPIWSPDGTKILFQSRRAGGDTEVFTMNVDGTGVKRLTNNPGFDGRCDWQPIPRVPGAPPIYDVPKSVTPPRTPSAGKLRTSLTLRARPRRDRRPPFIFTFSGRVRIPSGVSSASVCGGTVRLMVKKGRRTVASGAARVSKRCTYRKRITIRSTRRTGRRRARLRVSASFGGNASLSRASRSTTTVRIF